MVSWRFDGKRERKYFPTRVDAEAKRKELLGKIAREGAEGVHFDAAARSEWFAAKRIVEPLGVSLIEAASFYAQQHRDKCVSTSWVEAEFAYRESLERSNRREWTIKNAKRFLAAFQTWAGAQTLGDFSEANVAAFLGRSDWSPKTVATYRAALSGFGSFAVRRGWLRENPVERITPPRLDRNTPEIFSIDEANRLLTAASQLECVDRATGKRDRGRIVRRLCLLLLAGLRPEEVDRLSPQNILPDAIRVNEGKLRGRRSVRIVPLSPAFRAWWDAFPGETCPPNFRKLYRRARELAGIDKVGTDIARHTWISARLSQIHDEARVAREAGNSPEIIYSNYFQLIPEAEAVQLGGYCPLDLCPITA